MKKAIKNMELVFPINDIRTKNGYPVTKYVRKCRNGVVMDLNRIRQRQRTFTQYIQQFEAELRKNLDLKPYVNDYEPP